MKPEHAILAQRQNVVVDHKLSDLGIKPTQPHRRFGPEGAADRTGASRIAAPLSVISKKTGRRVCRPSQGGNPGIP
jgi:hypothetical protein